MGDDITIIKLLFDNISAVIMALVGGTAYVYTARVGTKRVDAKTETFLQGELYQQDQFSAAIELRRENEVLRKAEVERLELDIKALETEMECLRKHVQFYKDEAIEVRAELEKKEIELMQLRELYDSLANRKI